MSKKDEMVEFMMTLPLPTAIEALYEVLARNAKQSRKQYARGTTEYAYRLVYTITSANSQNEVEETLEYIVAVHDAAQYPPDATFSDVLSQGGLCGSCESHLLSYAKKVVCPVCGSLCYLT